MKTEVAFWDTSAIIPLCYLQDFSVEARKVHRKFATSFIWWGTVVEINSGLARLKRFDGLNDRDRDAAVRKWTAFYRKSRIVRPLERVLDIAVELPAPHGVRALDGFQLAAALVWCGERPRNRPFITADKRLGDAAQKAGFDVVSLV